MLMLKNANVLFIWKLYDLSTSVYMSCKCENIFPIVVKKKSHFSMIFSFCCKTILCL